MRSILELNWIEFFLRLLPETFIILWGINVVSQKSVKILKQIIFCIILSIGVFFVRWLPIYFGVHMIINIILTISISCITGIPIIRSMYSTLIIYFLLSLGELLDMILLNLLHFNTSVEFTNPVVKSLIGVPSLIFLLIFILIIKYVLKRKEDLNNVINRKSSN